MFRRQFENVADSSLPDFGVNVKKNESEDRVNVQFYKKFKNQKKSVIFFLSRTPRNSFELVLTFVGGESTQYYLN